MKLRRRCQQLGLCLFFPCLSFSFACLDPCLCCLFVVVVCFVFIMDCLDLSLSCFCFLSRSVWIHVFLVWFLFVWLVGWFLYQGVFGSISSLFGFCLFVLCITECWDPCLSCLVFLCLFVCFVYHGVLGSMSSLFRFVFISVMLILMCAFTVLVLF